MVKGLVIHCIVIRCTKHWQITDISIQNNLQHNLKAWRNSWIASGHRSPRNIPKSAWHSYQDGTRWQHYSQGMLRSESDSSFPHHKRIARREEWKQCHTLLAHSFGVSVSDTNPRKTDKRLQQHKSTVNETKQGFFFKRHKVLHRWYVRQRDKTVSASFLQTGLFIRSQIQTKKASQTSHDHRLGGPADSAEQQHDTCVFAQISNGLASMWTTVTYISKPLFQSQLLIFFVSSIKKRQKCKLFQWPDNITRFNQNASLESDSNRSNLVVCFWFVWIKTRFLSCQICHLDIGRSSKNPISPPQPDYLPWPKSKGVTCTSRPVMRRRCKDLSRDNKKQSQI